MNVRIVKNWSNPYIFRQTPRSSGVWDGIRFFEEDLPSDYVIVLNTPLDNTRIECPSENVWLIIQEPSNEETCWLHNDGKQYARIYTTDSAQRGTRIVYSQPALPWHVDKDYDFLKKVGPAEKDKTLSWITSSKKNTAGHRDRMTFLEALNSKVSFDLFGRGFTPINDKWDGLAYHKYSVAVENYSSPYYWTEKISDCFLSWTMPIYYGCTKITEYFPPESLLQIDIKDTNAIEIITDVIHSDRWKKNIDAIEYARNKILDEYQIFPFLKSEIDKHHNVHLSKPHSIPRILKPTEIPVSPMTKLKHRLGKYPTYRFLKRVYKGLKPPVVKNKNF